VESPGQFLPLQFAALKLCAKLFALKDGPSIREMSALLPYLLQLIVAAGGIDLP